jgi:hypothetical protein
LFRRNRRFTAAALSFFGERFQGLGGTIGSGTKGETERRVSALYRRGESSKQQGVNEELRGGGDYGSGSFRRGLRAEEEDD